MPVVVQLWYRGESKKKEPLFFKGSECGAGGIRII